MGYKTERGRGSEESLGAEETAALCAESGPTFARSETTERRPQFWDKPRRCLRGAQRVWEPELRDMLDPRALRAALCALSCAWLHAGAASRLKSPALPIQSEREPLPSKGLSGKESRARRPQPLGRASSQRGRGGGGGGEGQSWVLQDQNQTHPSAKLERMATFWFFCS